ncbi:MAG: FecR domain-containing protein [Bacteroidota bacterium]
MDKHQLLNKYLNGTSTAEEERRLFQILQEDDQDDFRELSQTLWKKIQADESDLSDSKERSYQRILARTDIRFRRNQPSFVWKAAAAITAIAIATAVLWWQVVYSEVKIANGFGETQTVNLPDGSTVRLNANSTLRYTTDWEVDEVREVWLTGEGYFTVNKVKNTVDQSVKFIVHAQDLSIQVLGTEFNVNSREEQVEVVLTEGLIELQLPKHDSPITMQPGEWVKYETTGSTIAKKRVNTEVYTAWKENQYLFDNRSLAEIANLIEYNYGLTVRFKTDSLANLRMSATIPSTDLDVLLEIIEQTLQVTVTRSASQIIIESNTMNTQNP